ncbi:MAG TPA: SDR family NAD(P)-dependent oxidoreductase [Acetobacteraceae bacterium]|nr:SDR family NAD(P)-dependent oxidoreductase [Acetobacteraceae bacterium]
MNDGPHPARAPSAPPDQVRGRLSAASGRGEDSPLPLAGEASAATAAPGEGALHGLTAIVTGGAKGIGRAIAARLAADGAALALIGRDAAALEQAAAALHARHAVADVTDRDALRVALEALGPCDILVNNAGAALSKPFLKHKPRDFQAMLAVNLLSAVTAARAVLPAMRARGFGRIVNIASTAGLKGYAYATAYVAAKHALVGFTRALAMETVKDGITVNAVCPGFTDTELVARSVATIAATSGRSAEEARELLARSNPAGRLVRPEEVAEAVAFLCRREAAAMTGQALVVACGEI